MWHTQSSLLLRKKEPTREKKKKKKNKIKQGARLLETLKKSHNTNTEFHYKEVTITSEGYKISLCISKVQLAKPFFTSANTRSRQKPQEKGRREGKRKRRTRRKRRGEGKRKRGRKRKKRRKKKNTEKAGLKSFPFKAHRPLRMPSLA